MTRRIWDDGTSKKTSDVVLTYRVLEGGSPSPWEFSYENSAFRLEIRDGEAEFAFRYPLTVNEGIARVNEFVRSWQGDRALQTGSLPRDFRLLGWATPFRQVGPLHRMVATVSGPKAAANTRRQMPWRRHEFYEIPILRALIGRYEAARAGSESLQVVAYLCLTALNDYFGEGGVRAACSISENVLRKITNLSSTSGDYATARKISSNHDLRELNAHERHWLETALCELLSRAGIVLQGHPLEGTLTQDDLPPFIST